MAGPAGAVAPVIGVLAGRSRPPVEAAGPAPVVGGGPGNIVDRLRQGTVTGFLDLFWQDWHCTAFNIADRAITFGAADPCLCPSMLRKGRGHA